MPSASELASYCKKLESEILSNTKTIRKAIMNTYEKVEKENVVLLTNLNHSKAIA